MKEPTPEGLECIDESLRHSTVSYDQISKPSIIGGFISAIIRGLIQEPVLYVLQQSLAAFNVDAVISKLLEMKVSQVSTQTMRKTDTVSHEYLSGDDSDSEDNFGKR